MANRIYRNIGPIADPAQRLANGIRYFTKHAHDDPLWGRFVCRFALSSDSLQEIWTGQAIEDLLEGLSTGRYIFQQEQARFGDDPDYRRDPGLDTVGTRRSQDVA